MGTGRAIFLCMIAAARTFVCVCRGFFISAAEVLQSEIGESEMFLFLKSEWIF